MLKRIHKLMAKMFNAAKRQPLAAIAVAGLALMLGSFGMAGHMLYTMQLKSAQQAHTEAIALNHVAMKLNAVDKRMRRQSRTLLAKIDELREANAMLAAYALRADKQTMRLENAVDYIPAGYGAFGGQWSVNLCGQVQNGADVGLNANLNLIGKIAGGIGAYVAGDGAKGEAAAKAKVDSKVDEKFNINVSAQVCDQIPLNNNPVLSQSNLRGYSFQQAGYSQQLYDRGLRPYAPSPGLDVNAIQTTGQQVEGAIANFLANHPKLISQDFPNAITALSNFKPDLTRQSIMNSVENPSQVFADFSGLIQTIPLPGNLSQVLSDPTSILPQLSDLSPETICNNAEATGQNEVLLNLCGAVPPQLDSFNNVSAFLGTATNFVSNFQSQVQGQIQSLQSGVASICNTVNEVTSSQITIPQTDLGSFTLPTGLTQDYVTIFGNKVVYNETLNSTTYNITFPQKQLPPLGIPPLQCSNL